MSAASESLSDVIERVAADEFAAPPLISPAPRTRSPAPRTRRPGRGNSFAVSGARFNPRAQAAPSTYDIVRTCSKPACAASPDPGAPG
jgi:hypothetical protein